MRIFNKEKDKTAFPDEREFRTRKTAKERLKELEKLTIEELLREGGE